jgi:hypothetical protein
VTGYGLDGRDSIPGKSKESLLLPTASTPALKFTQTPIQCDVYYGLFRRGGKTDHLPPSNAEVKNGGDELYFPMHLHGVVLK